VSVGRRPIERFSFAAACQSRGGGGGSILPLRMDDQSIEMVGRGLVRREVGKGVGRANGVEKPNGSLLVRSSIFVRIVSGRVNFSSAIVSAASRFAARELLMRSSRTPVTPRAMIL